MVLAFVAAAMFVSAFLQVCGGFGFALLAMPLLTLALSLDLAGPVVAATALLLNVGNTLRLRRYVNWPEWLRLSLTATLGVPLGFALAAWLPGGAVRVALGVLVCIYAGLSFVHVERRPALAPGWVYAAGLAAGSLAGAYNIAGPPVIVYGDARGWARDEYRSTLQAFFMLTGLLVVVGHGALGHFDLEVGRLVLVSLPCLALGSLAGQWADRFINPKGFRRVVLVLLLATGISLLV
jgi:uncharacterized membrane protein YfcA